MIKRATIQMRNSNETVPRPRLAIWQVIFSGGIALTIAMVTYSFSLYQTTDIAALNSRTVWLGALSGITIGILITTLFKALDSHDAQRVHKDKLTQHQDTLNHLLRVTDIFMMSKDIRANGILNEFNKCWSDYFVDDQNKSSIIVHDADINDLVDWKLERIKDKFIENLEVLGSGNIIIDEPYKEIATNAELLQKIPRNIVKAVSYEDEEFWTSNEGRNFLEAHRAVANKGVKVQRIFIVKGDISDRLSDNNSLIHRIFTEQFNAGVDLWFVGQAKLGNIETEDFVIYDDLAVRFARHAGGADDPRIPGIDKVATLSFTPRTVNKYSDIYKVIEMRSQKYTVAGNKGLR